MGRSVVRLALAITLVAGCNQVFGIEPTHLQDGDIATPIDAAPPVAIVQAIAREQLKTTSNTLAFMQAVTAGNAIVIGVYTESAVVVSVHDTLGTTYTQVIGPVALPVLSANMYLYAALGVAGGPDAVTVEVNPTQGANSPSIELYVHELANVAGLDGAAGMPGDSQVPDGTTSGSITTHGANEMILGFGVADSSMAAGTGFVTFLTYDNNLTEGLVVTAPGSYSATGTSVGSWTMLAVALAGR